MILLSKNFLSFFFYESMLSESTILRKIILSPMGLNEIRKNLLKKKSSFTSTLVSSFYLISSQNIQNKKKTNSLTHHCEGDCGTYLSDPQMSDDERCKVDHPRLLSTSQLHVWTHQPTDSPPPQVSTLKSDVSSSS